MPQFHETGLGQRYYNVQLPDLIRQLKRIADALESYKEAINGKSNCDQKSNDQ